MTDPKTASLTDFPHDLTDLRAKFGSLNEKAQFQFIPEILNIGERGLDILMDFLLEHRAAPPSLIVGKVYQILFESDSPTAAKFLQEYFPTGVVPLNSERNIDYLPLQQLLAAQDFEAADRMNMQKLCELAGASAMQRKWLYFTEVENFPITDLQTVNNLWLVHSEGKFGFSVQRELWLSNGKNFVKLWEKIGWKNGNIWTRYPKEFTWNLSAPRGHLPLSNQLRGVRVISSLLSHPAWSN